jgi:hypothetical protein
MPGWLAVNAKTVNQSLMVMFLCWQLLAEMADEAGTF